jgi:hypothetical protein
MLIASMKRNQLLLSLGICVCFLFFTGVGHCFEYRFGGEIFEGLFKEMNYIDYSDETTGTFDYDERYNILGIYPELYVETGLSVSGYFQGELEWIHSWDAQDKDDVDGEVAIAYISYFAPEGSTDIGILPFRIGNGLILYSDEPGIAFEYDGLGDAYVKGNAFLVFDKSPMASFSLGYRPGFLETIELVGAWYYDADDRIADLFDPEDTSFDVNSSGNLYWIGGDVNLFIHDFFVSCLILHQFGSAKINYSSGAQDHDLSSYLIDAEVNYNISPKFSAGAFIFLSSGDSQPMQGDLNAFISPIPYNERTVIFFNGGFERYDIEESVLLGGVTWAGVIAPGLQFDYQPVSDIVTKFVFAMMFPEGDLFNSNTWYGWEADVSLSYEFHPNYKLFAEADVFRHGNFIKQAQGVRPDPAYRFVLGCNLIF